ncbi:hypothetical protein LCGC14_0374620 [marine sediment metagenome]|uniref:Uncharacterized protein n=1 Tax=marine sediment metagenome TaxID=412755 RepID=A0A0F9TMB2_9ZZZZ
MTVDYNKLLGGLLFAFIGIIIGAVLLSTLSDAIVENTQETVVSLETIVMGSTTVDNATVTNERITTVSSAAPISLEGITTVSDAAPVDKEAITTASGTNTTVNGNVLAVTFFGNTTDNTTLDTINISANVNFTRAGVILVNENLLADDLYEITYTYAQNSSNTTLNENVISVTFFGNQTLNTSTDTANLTEQVNFTRAGLITVSPTVFFEGLYNVTYTYAQNSTNTTVNRNLIAVTFFGNQTFNTTLDTINISSQVNFTAAGVIRVTPTLLGDSLYNISYVHSTNITGTTANTNNVGAVTFFGNTTTNTSQSGVSVGTNVNVSTGGVVTISQGNFTVGNYEISYSFEGTEFVADSASRAILPLIPIFFALFVFLFGVVLVLQSGIADEFR